MNWVGTILILAGLVYLIYSILCKDKLTYYSKRRKIILIKSNEFLKLQLKFSMVSAICCIVFGVSIITFNLNNIFIIVGILIFHLINLLLIVEGKQKEYITYE